MHHADACCHRHRDDAARCRLILLQNDERNGRYHPANGAENGSGLRSRAVPVLRCQPLSHADPRHSRAGAPTLSMPVFHGNELTSSNAGRSGDSCHFTSNYNVLVKPRSAGFDVVR
jgi:hypothetical protein